MEGENEVLRNSNSSVVSSEEHLVPYASSLSTSEVHHYQLTDDIEN